MKNSFNFKNVVALVAASLFIFTLFFNVSLVQNEGEGFSLSLASLKSAHAQDPEIFCQECENQGNCCSSETICVTDSRTGERICWTAYRCDPCPV